MLIKNGIIVQVRHDGAYQGIEGENWSFDFSQADGNLEEYYDNNIDVSWQKENHVDCCNDIEYIRKYVAELKKNQMKYRILLCETNMAKPMFQECLTATEFLGFDYAYAGGSFYSCINSDIISKRIPELINIQLNKSGLFENERELFDFIQRREELSVQYPERIFEKGDFIVYKLSEVLEV